MSFLILPLLQFLERRGALSASTREKLTSACTFRRMRRHAQLLGAGEVCRDFFFLNRGLARIYHEHDGCEVTDGFVAEGRLFTRMESLMTGRPVRKTVSLLEDSDVVVLDAGRLFSLYAECPELETVIHAVMEEEAAETSLWLERTRSMTAEHRYRLLMGEQPGLMSRVPLKHIASFLGITQASLSRIRAKM